MYAERKRYRALPRHRRLIEDALWYIRRGVWNQIKHAKFAIRVRFNRAVHGYDEFDWWEYYSNTSRRALKLLPKLKGKGCPGSFLDSFNPSEEDADAAYARWDAMLDDMIYFHNVCAGNVQACGGETVGFEGLTKAAQQRYRRGKYYYFKYYEHLWD